MFVGPVVNYPWIAIINSFEVNKQFRRGGVGPMSQQQPNCERSYLKVVPQYQPCAYPLELWIALLMDCANHNGRYQYRQTHTENACYGSHLTFEMWVPKERWTPAHSMLRRTTTSGNKGISIRIYTHCVSISLRAGAITPSDNNHHTKHRQDDCLGLTSKSQNISTQCYRHHTHPSL
jgi:hypothetical protein